MTFLSLPGLDAFSRTTGMVAIVFATFSMAATVVAIFRHKADLERPISYTGIEGIAVITVRRLLMTLFFFSFQRTDQIHFCFLEANCCLISTTCLFGLFYYSVHCGYGFVLIQRGGII